MQANGCSKLISKQIVLFLPYFALLYCLLSMSSLLWFGQKCLFSERPLLSGAKASYPPSGSILNARCLKKLT